METLNITKANALAAYEQANDKGKLLLTNLFGKDTFAKIRFKDFTDIKTLADVIEYLGDEDADVKAIQTGLPADVLAYLQLRIIVKAINGGKFVDWKNTSVNKYYPWFCAFGAPSGFSFSACDCNRSNSCVGSRLCYSSSDRAVYAGKQFLEIYNNYIN